MIERFNSVFDMLGSQPLLGEARTELGHDFRAHVLGNYLIIYRPLQRQIQILRIIHAARDLKQLFPAG
jgi:toxin ParE1/3/4